MAQLVFAVVELMRGNVLLISIFCLRKRLNVLGAGTAGLSCGDAAADMGFDASSFDVGSDRGGSLAVRFGLMPLNLSTGITFVRRVYR